MILDFDHPNQWVPQFASTIEPYGHAIALEIEAQRRHFNQPIIDRSEASSPSTTHCDRALQEISEKMAGSCVRAFHATRHFDPNSFLERGLLALNRIDQIRKAASAISAFGKPDLNHRVVAWKLKNGRPTRGRGTAG